MNVGRAEMDRLVCLLRQARQAVVFTGAGISTESGIPDFRSPGGVWSKMKPIEFQDFLASGEMRREAWKRKFSGDDRMENAEPNLGHKAVARLVELGKVQAVITQNVDGLHQRSGVSGERVIELHGNSTYARCLQCGTRYELAELRAEFLRTQNPPLCSLCDGIIKTATISFGQPMPVEEVQRAEQLTRACDLFLVLGSSLVVYPAADFPLMAKRNGARLLIVNREPTHLDQISDLTINAELGTTLRDAVFGTNDLS